MMTRSRHWLSLVAIWLLPGPSERTWRKEEVVVVVLEGQEGGWGL